MLEEALQKATNARKKVKLQLAKIERELVTYRQALKLAEKRLSVQEPAEGKETKATNAPAKTQAPPASKPAKQPKAGTNNIKAIKTSSKAKKTLMQVLGEEGTGTKKESLDSLAPTYEELDELASIK